ncbi:unnamed protein product [Protopolystoma xenopodis]|uniref:Uncharacterized protein n=1 Tax=Protopolystoma xenopodis TaxID=117903 RepID=A0A448WAF6_9PLAT|nr:unnamed protein product [Protopolystoma xenopodis]
MSGSSERFATTKHSRSDSGVSRSCEDDYEVDDAVGKGIGGEEDRFEREEDEEEGYTVNVDEAEVSRMRPRRVAQEFPASSCQTPSKPVPLLLAGLAGVLSECWHPNPGARVTALRVKKKLQRLASHICLESAAKAGVAVSAAESTLPSAGTACHSHLQHTKLLVPDSPVACTTACQLRTSSASALSSVAEQSSQRSAHLPDRDPVISAAKPPLAAIQDWTELPDDRSKEEICWNQDMGMNQKPISSSLEQFDSKKTVSSCGELLSSSKVLPTPPTHSALPSDQHNHDLRPLLIHDLLLSHDQPSWTTHHSDGECFHTTIGPLKRHHSRSHTSTDQQKSTKIPLHYGLKEEHVSDKRITCDPTTHEPTSPPARGVLPSADRLSDRLPVSQFPGLPTSQISSSSSPSLSSSSSSSSPPSLSSSASSCYRARPSSLPKPWPVCSSSPGLCSHRRQGNSAAQRPDEQLHFHRLAHRRLLYGHIQDSGKENARPRQILRHRHHRYRQQCLRLSRSCHFSPPLLDQSISGRSDADANMNWRRQGARKEKKEPEKETVLTPNRAEGTAANQRARGQGSGRTGRANQGDAVGQFEPIRRSDFGRLGMVGEEELVLARQRPGKQWYQPSDRATRRQRRRVRDPCGLLAEPTMLQTASNDGWILRFGHSRRLTVPTPPTFLRSVHTSTSPDGLRTLLHAPPVPVPIPGKSRQRFFPSPFRFQTSEPSAHSPVCQVDEWAALSNGG